MLLKKTSRLFSGLVMLSLRSGNHVFALNALQPEPFMPLEFIWQIITNTLWIPAFILSIICLLGVASKNTYTLRGYRFRWMAWGLIMIYVLYGLSSYPSCQVGDVGICRSFTHISALVLCIVQGYTAILLYQKRKKIECSADPVQPNG